MKKSTIAFVLIAAFSFANLLSCKTYYIPVDSFEQQLRSNNSALYREVNIPFVSNGGLVGAAVGAAHGTTFYTNGITSITCVDKENNVHELENSPAIELRVTQHDGKRTVFYFDTVRLQDGMIVGCVSRFLQQEKSIPLSSIQLIEVQNGGKNFTYKGEKRVPQNDSLY